MKGQLTIQYLASFIFFLGLVIYIYFSYSANLPAFVEEVRKEDVRSKAFQLSEILINDLGLSDENFNKTNLITMDKVRYLEDLCISFENVQQKLAIDEPFSIHVFNMSQDIGKRNSIMECVPPDFPKTIINATIKRIVALDNTENGQLELAEIIVQM